jgi:hypothetical protein
MTVATYGRIKLCVVAAAAFLSWQSGPSWAQAVATTRDDAVPDTSLPPGGQHDFDFLIGAWNIHFRRLVHPLSGPHEWIELDGTTVCKTLFDGRAEIEEMSVDSANKQSHIQGLALRLYNPSSHQWSIGWANAKDGTMSPPPMVGEFKNGRGEFYDQDVFNGRAVFTRFVWTGVNTKSPDF